MNRALLDEAVRENELKKKEKTVKLTLEQLTGNLRSIPRPVASEIKKLRKRQNISQGVLGAAVGASKRNVNNWEQGKGEPSIASSILFRLIEKHPEVMDMIKDL
ncbi:MAG TPA: type II toxin-antitoxin system MqsA family antitoxin [Methanosarcina sp.]|nr:type II toxin-antitoxin system MqsA family antitoxin [Methanosarcina sp.]